MVVGAEQPTDQTSIATSRTRTPTIFAAASGRSPAIHAHRRDRDEHRDGERQPRELREIDPVWPHDGSATDETEEHRHHDHAPTVRDPAVNDQIEQATEDPEAGRYSEKEQCLGGQQGALTRQNRVFYRHRFI